MDDDFKQIVADLCAEEERRRQADIEINTRIFEELKVKLSKEYVVEITDCLTESSADGQISIVTNPGIKPQKEEWNHFDHILVDQYVDGGYEGDTFEGYIYIPVHDGLYLKSHYSM